MSNRTVSEIGEHALIARITERLAMPSWVLVGPGDDAAVIEPERNTLDVLTTDAQVDGVHFDTAFVPPDAIGHRALAVNLSDLAAMGARPRAALLSLVLPGDLAVSAVDAIVDGLLALAAKHQVALVGGNITRSPGPLMIDVTAIGSVKPRCILTRAGARPGDEVYVTGSVGGGLVGLRSLQEGRPEGRPLQPISERAGVESAPGVEAGPPGVGTGPPGVRTGPASVGTGPAGVGTGPAGVEADLQVGLNEQRYLRPQPRMRAGMLLGRNRAASACIDLSDGLADGLRQIAAASNVGIVVDADCIPFADGVLDFHRARGSDAIAAALAGGDDYELLFTTRPSWRGRFRAVRSQVGDLPITKIGVVTKSGVTSDATEDRRVVVRTPEGERGLPAGFEHFR